MSLVSCFIFYTKLSCSPFSLFLLVFLNFLFCLLLLSPPTRFENNTNANNEFAAQGCTGSILKLYSMTNSMAKSNR